MNKKVLNITKKIFKITGMIIVLILTFIIVQLILLICINHFSKGAFIDAIIELLTYALFMYCWILGLIHVLKMVGIIKSKKETRKIEEKIN